jgi:hypothetical protein
MVEHLAIGDLGTLLLVLGLTGPVLAPVLRIGFFDRLRVLAHPLGRLPAVGAEPLPVARALLPRGRRAPPRRPRAAALRLRGVRLQHVDGAAGPLPKPAWFGNLARLGYIIAVRLTAPSWATSSSSAGHIFFGSTRRASARTASRPAPTRTRPARS